MRTYPKMNRAIVGILRHGNEPSQYAAQRIVEIEAEITQLREAAAAVVEAFVGSCAESFASEALDVAIRDLALAARVGD